MPSVYSIQFEVDPANGRSPRDAFDGLGAEILAWIEGKYERWGLQTKFTYEDGPFQPLPDHSVRSSLHEAEGGILRRVRWVHPDEDDDSMRWTTDIAIASIEDRLEFSLQLGVASASFVLAPAWHTVGRPRIVTQILTQHQCSIDGHPIPTSVQRIQALDVPAFVNNVLLDRKRVLPIVVVSQDPFSGVPVADTRELQTALVGFAMVCILDKWAAFKLTDAVGKFLSCYNGCVRIYWPKFAPSDDPRQHPLYFPDRINYFQQSGKSLDQRLFAFLAKVSAFRFSEGAVLRKAQALIARHHIRLAEARRKEMEQAAKDAANLHDVQELLDMALTDNDSLREQNQQLEEQNKELSEELSSQKANWEVYREYQKVTADEEEEQQVKESSDLEFDSICAALSKAEEDFTADLLILKSAVDSAEESQFARPTEVYRALMAIREIGRSYVDDIPIGGWSQQLSERGFNQYSPTESPTVKNDHRKYAKYREFQVNGDKREIYQHLDLGGGDRKNCLQIYFEADKKIGKVIIAYCGEHLPFPRQRT